MATWRAEVAKVEAIVDAHYGEQVRLLPYRKTAYMSVPAPDPTRAITNGVGVVIGKGSFLRAAGNASFIAKRTEADLLLSIQDKYLTNIQTHDRVKLLDTERNGMFCEISFIEIGMNGRSVLHLLHSKEPT